MKLLDTLRWWIGAWALVAGSLLSGPAAADVSSALLDRAAAFAEDCACTRMWGVPRPGASLYDGGGAQVSSLDIPL